MTVVNSTDLSVSPYYDRFDNNANRIFVAFQADKILQGSELNEVQSIFSYYLQALGNSVMSDGDKQAGMSYTQKGMDITVESGLVYIAGKVRNFSEQTVTITGNGLENVGIYVQQDVVTSADDSSLLNPAIGTPGYQADGANRLHEEVILTANDSKSTPIYTFKDGTIYYVPENTQLAKVSNMMAQQTSEIEGNFRVGSTGFQMSTQEDASDNKKAILNIGAGVAYILGKRINKSVATQLNIDRALATSTVTDEQDNYSSDTSKYALGSNPIQNVTTVTANVQKTITISRGTTNVDNLADKTVTKIKQVFTEGSTGKTFVEGTDYSLTNHQSITWLPNGSTVSQGLSYKVTYVYTKVLSNGSDYEVSTDSNNISYIDLSGKGIIGSGDSTGGVLTSDSILSITYNYYLARIDIVTLDKDANFVLHPGQPGDLGNVYPPLIRDSSVLEIGTVSWVPNSWKTTCQTYATSNLTFTELTRLRDRVDNVEFNEALQALDNKATAQYDPTQLRGVFSDGFISFDKSDITNDDWSVMMNFEDGTITTQYSQRNEFIPKILEGQSNIDLTANGKFVTAAYTETAIVSQPIVTSAVLINEYSYYGKEGSLTLSPNTDSWVTQSS